MNYNVIFCIQHSSWRWTCVHTVVQYFSAFEKFIPWIALILLLYIGGVILIGIGIEIFVKGLVG